jgi:hypothetical protein
VAVSGKLSSALSLAVTVDVSEQLSDAVFPQNHPPANGLGFRIDRIEPSSARLEDLAAPPYVPSTIYRFLCFMPENLTHHIDKDPIQAYAADLLAAFRHMKDPEHMVLFLKFVVRSCLPKITHRLAADRYVFKRPLEDILEGWTPGSRDTFASKQVFVKKIHRILLPHLASCSIAGQEDQYQWNTTTASTWLTALGELIKKTKCLANDCHNRENKAIDSAIFTDLVVALNSLCFLAYRVPIQELLALPSIRSRLTLELTNNHFIDALEGV